jgi:hypothetical protein
MIFCETSTSARDGIQWCNLEDVLTIVARYRMIKAAMHWQRCPIRRATRQAQFEFKVGTSEMMRQNSAEERRLRDSKITIPASAMPESFNPAASCRHPVRKGNPQAGQ